MQQTMAAPQADTVYDSKSQYERVLAQLLQGERLYYVFDLKGAGTGFLGITDRRLLFIDQGVRDRKDVEMVTLPYSKIGFLGMTAEHRFLARDTGAVSVTVTGGRFDFAFHGLDKAHRAYRAIAHHLCQ